MADLLFTPYGRRPGGFLGTLLDLVGNSGKLRTFIEIQLFLAEGHEEWLFFINFLETLKINPRVSQVSFGSPGALESSFGILEVHRWTSRGSRPLRGALRDVVISIFCFPRGLPGALGNSRGLLEWRSSWLARGKDCVRIFKLENGRGHPNSIVNGRILELENTGCNAHFSSCDIVRPLLISATCILVQVRANLSPQSDIYSLCVSVSCADDDFSCRTSFSPLDIVCLPCVPIIRFDTCYVLVQTHIDLLARIAAVRLPGVCVSNDGASIGCFIHIQTHP